MATTYSYNVKFMNIFKQSIDVETTMIVGELKAKLREKHTVRVRIMVGWDGKAWPDETTMAKNQTGRAYVTKVGFFIEFKRNSTQFKRNSNAMQRFERDSTRLKRDSNAIQRDSNAIQTRFKRDSTRFKHDSTRFKRN